jgi:hypothetical protein
VFLINSRLGLFTAAPSGLHRKSAHPTGAPLLPKLRGQFAEFLNEGFPARLRILSPPTCVGLRYGHPKTWLEAFLGSMGSASSLLKIFAPHRASGLASRRICLPALPTRLDALNQRCAAPTLLRHPIAHSGLQVALEFPPVVHRLRHPASA